MTHDLDALFDFEKLEKVGQSGSKCIPVVVQDYKTLRVLILGYVNAVALRHTMDSGYVMFWSTSRRELWDKGKTSGNRLKIIDIRVNCEENSLLFLVDPEGSGACHTQDSLGYYRESCFYRRLTSNGLEEL